MPISTPATRALDSLGIPYRVLQHSQPPDSLEQAARERGQVPEQVIRSIVFRVSKGECFMVLVAGPVQVSWPSLRAHLGTSRLSMASEAEVLEVTGYRVGTVSPFGLPRPIQILADESIFVHEEISLGSGERGAALLMERADLRKALGNIVIGRFAQK